MSEIALTGFIQCLFFAFLIIFKKARDKKDVLLVILLLFVSAELIFRYLLEKLPPAETRWLVLFDITYWAMFGPLTYLYIRYATGGMKKLRAIHLLHLLPLIVGLFGVMGFYTGGNYYHYFSDYFNESTGLQKLALLVWDYASPVYLLYSLLVLYRHRTGIRNYFTDISKRDLKWLRILVSGFLVYILASYVIMILQAFTGYDPGIESIEMLPVVLTVYVFVLGFFGYRQPGFLFDVSPAEVSLSKSKISNGDAKYAGARLHPEEHRQIKENLLAIMESEKPFVEPDLNIGALACKLDTSIHKLSQVINESFDQNFFDFINSYRIQEVKHLLVLPEYENLTIISAAWDCGFSSKSSFYNAFRKNTGKTPGEFLKELKAKRESVLA